MGYYKRLKVAILNDEYFVTILLGDKEMAKKAMLRNYPGLYTELQQGVGLHPKDPDFYSTVAHEAIHAIDFIFDEIGEEAKVNEIYAHCPGRSHLQPVPSRPGQESAYRG